MANLSAGDHISATAEEALPGANPFIGFKPRDVARKAVRAAKLLVVQPHLALAHSVSSAAHEW
jgi:hypothetical protein